jgi:hypothetical protein
MFSVENTSGAKVKIAKYGATRQHQKMHANAVRERMPGAHAGGEQVAQPARLDALARELFGREVGLSAEVFVDDPSRLLDPIATHQPAG